MNPVMLCQVLKHCHIFLNAPFLWNVCPLTVLVSLGFSVCNARLVNRVTFLTLGSPVLSLWPGFETLSYISSKLYYPNILTFCRVCAYFSIFFTLIQNCDVTPPVVDNFFFSVFEDIDPSTCLAALNNGEVVVVIKWISVLACTVQQGCLSI